MNLPRFELEHFLAAHEHDAKHVLGTSGIATLPASELPTSLGELPLDYGPVPGDPRLTRAIAAARGVPESHVLVTVGGTEALFLVPFALVHPGDRVLVETPTYHPLRAVPQALGARVTHLERRMEQNWELDIDEAIRLLDEDVSLVSLTSPNNPTGRATKSSELVRLAEACDEVGAWLLVDQIFRSAVQPQPPVAHTLHPRIITAESLTKCYGVSGLRAGWLLADLEVREALREAKALTSIVNPSITQHLAVDVLHHEARILERTLRITHANLARWRTFVRSHPALAWREPDSPLITAVKLPEGMDDVKHCEQLLREESVLLVPGTHLGLPGYVRLGFGAEPATFAAGLDGWSRVLRAAK